MVSLTEKLKKSEELNQNIEKEGDTGIRTLSEEKQILEGEVKRLKAELKRITQEKDQVIEQLIPIFVIGKTNGTRYKFA